MSSLPSKPVPSRHSINGSNASMIKTQSIFNSSIKLQNNDSDLGLKR